MKRLIALSIAAIIMVSSFAFIGSAGTTYADEHSSYTTKNGVLDSDYFTLYPYANKSVKFGFSKYGELLGIPAGLSMSNQTNWVGMEYGGRDPFAPADTITMVNWINGWYLNVEYICPVMTGVKRDRQLFAFAMFADGFGWGGDWEWAQNPGDAPYGGRKTNGSCTTEDLKILYDGPRRFIAQSVTHVNDTEVTATWPVLDVIITVEFNKVKKEIILLKDLKLTIEKMKLKGYVDVQFSNREEYDLGPSNGYTSYAHFYEEDWGDTCMTSDWHMAQDLVRDNVTHITGDGTTKIFPMPLAAGFKMGEGFMKAWVDGVYKDRPLQYDVDWATGIVTFVVAPADDSDIEFHYKYIFKSESANRGGNTPGWDHEYDIAQVISSDEKYVAFAAFWPPVSDYTVDGINWFLQPLVMVREADMDTEPWRSPLVIGEWDMLLDTENVRMFRCVEVKGIVDRHDGDDWGSRTTRRGVHENVIDREVYYQLDEVFLPWDLYSAVEKQEYRWVYIDDVTETTNQIDLTDGLYDRIYFCNMTDERTSLGLTTPQWTGYFVREEEGTYPVDSAWVNEPYTHSKNWAMLLNGTGGWEMLKVTPIADKVNTTALDTDKPLSLQFQDLTDFDFWYKNITGTYGPHVEVKLVQNQDGTGYWANIQARTSNKALATDWTHYTLDTIESFVDGSSDTAFQVTGGDVPGLDIGHFHSYEHWTSDSTLKNYYVASVGVQVESGCKAYVDDISVGYVDRPSGIRYERVYNMEEDKLIPTHLTSYDEWDQYKTFAERVLVDGVLIAPFQFKDLDPVLAVTGTHRPYYNINYANGTIWLYHWSSGAYHTWDLDGSHVKVLYSTIEENDKGRYEWAVLGRDAATSDSLGATLITAALKNKDVEIGLAGEDMMYQEWGYASIPYVMCVSGTAPGTRTDYKWQADPTSPGQRSALRDDWCTTWPVSSSNMIGVGGPLANMFAYYFNDFTDAFYGLNVDWLGEDFTDYAPWEGALIAFSCWNGTKKGYTSSADTGYATIGTYMDINGTVGLLVWGLGPRDTYYASKFFHEELIYELQHFPRCITSIVLKIDYTSPSHPTFTIDECLGKVSETTVIENGGSEDEITKGGIHDP